MILMSLAGVDKLSRQFWSSLWICANGNLFCRFARRVNALLTAATGA